MPSQVPTTVFSGFLGSGKTTIITHLVDELQSTGQQVIYIKNEIGDENVDAEIMEGKNIKTKELLNGCICCTLVGPFIQAINEVVDQFMPNRIIIEASGAADPAAIALMIDSQPRLKRDGVISIVDVTNFKGYKDISQTARNQTKFTDLIVFNKVELADLKTKQAVVGYVRELNEHSPIVEAPGGQLKSVVAFGISEEQLGQLDELLADAGFSAENSQNDTHPDHDHLHHDGIESFTLQLPPLNQRQMQSFLTDLPGSVYRVKGILYTEHPPLLINKVGNRLTIEPAQEFNNQGDNKSKLVLIGFRIKQQQTQIEQQLHSLINE